MTAGATLDIGVREISNELDGNERRNRARRFLRSSHVAITGMKIGMVDHPNEATLTVRGTSESTLASS